MDDTQTCYHEAGHAVMAYLLGGIAVSVSLGGEADEWLPNRFGECRIEWPIAHTRSSQRYREMLTLLAGPVAEQIIDDDPHAMLASIDDVQRATRLAATLTSNAASMDKLLRRGIADIRMMFADEATWAAVAAIADELDAHESLDADDLASVLEFWL